MRARSRYERRRPQRRVTIEVQDSGMGMTTEVRERLFRPFEQGDRSITRRFGGLGLGLYLAKSIIELHGGTTSASTLWRG